MKNLRNDCVWNEERRGAVQGELLEFIIQDEPYIYPWDVTDPEVDSYLDHLEQEFLGEPGWNEEELATQSYEFFATAEKCWLNVREKGAVNEVRSSLLAQFGDRIPHDWLDAIVQQAETLIHAPLSPIDRLIECVKPLLDQWSSEDLQIFARPLVYAMRSHSVPKPQDSRSWEQLSTIEQARYTLQVAQQVLTELEDH
ncbi:hypothetical protein K4A83_13920 [Spirulina subsalsa FACHB-351]|uniref:Uncharacterized protein n=1 Tax=Spirulina subsalsa FACHB-351 TaxID=234711 RepID=A0ABT3L776_9CYAN|nr:hypothetical protein [Spirulina subsalsa]MCW6037361.1 hypothetical protein [Spirulina subsalsa FACHB-351]